jgi:hypothetical protein
MMIVATFSIVLITNVSNVEFQLTLSNLRQLLNEKQNVFALKKRTIQEMTNALVQ